MPPKEINKTSEILKNRIKACKKFLPNNWRQQIIEFAPQYDSLKGARLMDNVFKLRSSDLQLTELIEKIIIDMYGKEVLTEEVVDEELKR
jgi:hypothetical protein